MHRRKCAGREPVRPSNAFAKRTSRVTAKVDHDQGLRCMGCKQGKLLHVQDVTSTFHLILAVRLS